VFFQRSQFPASLLFRSFRLTQQFAVSLDSLADDIAINHFFGFGFSYLRNQQFSCAFLLWLAGASDCEFNPVYRRAIIIFAKCAVSKKEAGRKCRGLLGTTNAVSAQEISRTLWVSIYRSPLRPLNEIRHKVKRRIAPHLSIFALQETGHSSSCSDWVAVCTL